MKKDKNNPDLNVTPDDVLKFALTNKKADKKFSTPIIVANLEGEMTRLCANKDYDKAAAIFCDDYMPLVYKSMKLGQIPAIKEKVSEGFEKLGPKFHKIMSYVIDYVKEQATRK
ncbi:MAG: hypothetical protein JSS76_13010 [Bacteroidetes bacterium]|nr:hypothetical protein [Bacteroidota bacterium]